MKSIIVFGTAFALLFSSCANDQASEIGKTPIQIKMTDAPGPYESIFLNIDALEIITSAGRQLIDLDDRDPFDILKFTMGRDTLLATDEVASGVLQEVRLILEDEGNEVIIDGISYPLTTPSGQSSGVKIKVQEQLIPNVAYTLLLDFDAASSIHSTGSGKYMLKPVIRAIPNAVSGVIRGIILPIESAGKVYAIQGTEDPIGAIINEDGEFYFPGIENGTYTISIEPENEAYADHIIENVLVENGAAKDLGSITLVLKP